MTLPRVLFVTGKGGTGKSTVAAALAIALSRRRPTTLADLDRRLSAAAALGAIPQDSTRRQSHRLARRDRADAARRARSLHRAYRADSRHLAPDAAQPDLRLRHGRAAGPRGLSAAGTSADHGGRRGARRSLSRDRRARLGQRRRTALGLVGRQGNRAGRHAEPARRFDRQLPRRRDALRRDHHDDAGGSCGARGA